MKSWLLVWVVFNVFVGLIATSGTVAAETRSVDLVGIEFDPSSLSIDTSDTVIWTYQESAASFGNHNIIFQSSKKPADDAPTAKGSDDDDWELNTTGDTYSLTFESKGNYRYRCTYHSEDFESGMSGIVKVGEDSDSTPFLGVAETAFAIVAVVAIISITSGMRRNQTKDE